MTEFKSEPIEDFYEIHDEIGSGQFAVVRRLKRRTNGGEFAGKFIRKRRVKASRRGAAREDIQREVDILAKVDHENIVKLYEVYEDKHQVILVLELVSGGELFEFLSERDKVNEDEAVEFLKQILEGVKHLHDKSIVHLDLKPENLILLHQNSTRLKLIDFGLSRVLNSSMECRELLGTPEFVAPEVINFDPLTLKTDMWSIGVITYIMLSGCSPFLANTKQETLSNVSAINYTFETPDFKNTSDLAKDFISKLLIRDPRCRASVDDCLKHPWIQPVEEHDTNSRKSSSINIDNLKSFLARQRWKHSVKIVQLCNRLSKGSISRSPGYGVVSTSGSSSHQEDEEENFVLTALCRAIEDGDLEGMKQVLAEAKSFDINQTNRQGETLLHTAASSGHVDIIKFLQEKGIPLDAADKHGDTAVYWAARQGHLEVIRYLVQEGVSLNTQNKAGEAPIHVAARYGHLDLIEYLCNANADVNVQDKLGETALHTVAWHGLPPDICALLCSSGCKVDTRNKENETPLHCAAARGNIECVRVLLSHGASLNVQDKRLNTPLHLACRRRYVSIALLLLHADCAFDMTDCINETPLHPASREGLLPVVQTMCAYGCQVDVVNKGGLTPLHLAARSGHIEVVRCLLLSGSEPELPNKDGVNSEIMALAQGHQEVAELLSKLKPEKREICIRQLIPTNQSLSRIKVKVFGSSAVGKTTLIESLKCGYLSSFFRKAKLGTSSSTSMVRQKAQQNGSLLRQNSLPTQLSFEVGHEGYTQGIDVQQVNISGGAGELSIWEFSGYEPYYVTYDHFIGDPNCVHVIVFSLADPQDVQLSQVLFWLNFLKARIAPMEPIGPVGRLPWPARVLLVATHADKADCVKNTHGELENPDAYVLLATIKQKYESDLFIQDEIFIMDAHLAMSQDLKSLRAKLGQMKNEIIQFLPCSNGFLEATVGALSVWRKALSDYPVVTWPVFMDYVRSKVNLLSSEEHLKELMCQLQLIGEVIYIETEGEQDLVVLNPKWLCCDVIGQLLSHDQLSRSRPTGCFSIDDFQLMCPETDAKDMLMILEALELCTRCEVDGEVEYEFPCLNFVEMIPGLWEKDDSRMVNPVYGGMRIQCPRGMNNQLLHMFPRIQTHLRREMLSDHGRPDADLYQWYHGSKFCSGSMECLITLGQSEQVVEMKCRGPEEFRTSLYYLQEDICDIVLDVIEDSCPGICLEKYILSATQLKHHASSVYAYTPKDILSAQLEGTTGIALDENTQEEFIDLIAFGSQEIWNNITPGIDLHAHFLSIHARRRLSMLLDPPDPMGRDWCLLAVALGMTDDLPRVDQSENQMVRSKTDTILDMWAQDQKSTIAVLIRKLKELGRQDAADTLLTVSPLYHVFQDGDNEDKTNNEPTPYSSDNTLSSSNLSR